MRVGHYLALSMLVAASGLCACPGVETSTREPLAGKKATPEVLEKRRPQKPRPEVLEKHRMTKILIGAMDRASDLAVSPDGTRAWASTDLRHATIYVMDAVAGRLLGHFGTLNQPSFVHYNVTDQRLYVVDEAKVARNGKRGAVIRAFDPKTRKEVRTILVNDWRLFRVSDVAFSNDGRWLWLSSSRATTSRWGPVAPALFRVDLKNGAWKRLVGRPPEDPAVPAGKPGTALNKFMIAASPQGRLFVTGLKPKTLTIFPAGGNKPDREVALPLEPVRMHLIKTGKVLIMMDKKKLILLDARKPRISKALRLEGEVTALAEDPARRRAYLKLRDKPKILVLRTDTGKFEKPINVTYFKKMHEPFQIKRLVWRNNPGRLIALARSGYCLAIINPADGVMHAVSASAPRLVKIGPAGRRVYVLCAGGQAGQGLIAVIDQATDRFLGTIQTGGLAMDLVFLPGGKQALVADALNKSLLTIDLEKATVTKRLKLRSAPWRLLLSKDGKSVGVPLFLEHPDAYAVVNLETSKVDYYAQTQKLPPQWEHLRRISQLQQPPNTNLGPKTGAGITKINPRGGGTPMLRLRSGKEIPLPDGLTRVWSATVDPEEKYVYFLAGSTSGARKVLYKFPLTDPPKKSKESPE